MRFVCSNAHRSTRGFLFEGSVIEEGFVSDPISISISPELCRGCRRCELACNWRDIGPLNPRLAGIHILKTEKDGIDHPVINMECLEHFCGKIDPRRSTEREPACVTACLFGALKMKDSK
jgi:Fe-S-cluster-containing dehydrogenase component